MGCAVAVTAAQESLRLMTSGTGGAGGGAGGSVAVDWQHVARLYRKIIQVWLSRKTAGFFSFRSLAAHC